MRYVGMALIVLSAALISSAYRARLSARTAALEALVALAIHIRSRVSGYLEPPDVWAQSHRTEHAAVAELLERIRSGDSPEAAYLSVADGLSLSAEASEVFGGFFSALGRGDMGEERKKNDSCVDKLSELLEKERDECAQRGRIAAIMALMLSAGGVILII